METDSRLKPSTEGSKKPNRAYFLAILSAWRRTQFIQRGSHRGTTFNFRQRPDERHSARYR